MVGRRIYTIMWQHDLCFFSNDGRFRKESDAWTVVVITPTCAGISDLCGLMPLYPVARYFFLSCVSH